jgi:cytochrome b561
VGSRLGIAVILLGVLFAALEGNEWMRQGVMEAAAPPTLEMPAADCPEDELEEEGLSAAECEQLVSDVRSYLASRPDWFFEVQTALACVGTLLAFLSIVAGAWLVNGRVGSAALGLFAFAALSAIDVGHFVAAQLAGPILRGIHLPPALLWFFVHLALSLACYAARQRDQSPRHVDESVRAYGRFEVATHWFVAVSVFFLFVSSWWMLALPLPNQDFRFREFPFQLHKNLGLTIMLLLIAMALIRLLRRQALAAVPAETAFVRQLRVSGHVALYVLIFAVCSTGFMSSTYSGWTTTLWWLFDLPYWGREDEELNQLFSDLHFWSCWGLLLAMAAHIGAALLHAFRDDGIVRRILRM